MCADQRWWSRKPEKVPPLVAHVVIRDLALARRARKQVGAWFDWAIDHRVRGKAVLPSQNAFELGAILGPVWINHPLAVDAVATERPPPALKIPIDRLI